MRRQSQVTEQTRANLTQAFWELYLQKPIEKITIREITDRAGYNRATFYLYYHDVYDLFEQLEDAVISEVRMLVDERLMRGETLDFSQHMSLIVSMAQRFDGYMPRLMSGDPTFADKLKTVLVPLLDRFVVCDEGLDEHGRHLLRELFATGLLGAINAWMIDSDRMPIDQFVELIARTVLPESARSETCMPSSSDCPDAPPEKERNRG